MGVAVIIELLGNKGDPISYNVGDATAIAKGELVKLADNRTIVTSASGLCGGVAAAEKVASDGQTQIAVYTNGIFDLLNSNAAAIGVGVPVIMDGANTISVSANGDTELGKCFGFALAAAAKNATEEVRVLI